MFVGVCSLELVLAENHSLKGKRRVLRTVKDRVRNTFNISIAEVDMLDAWQRCTLGLSCVGREKPHVEQQLSNVVEFIDKMHLAEIENVHIEII